MNPDWWNCKEERQRINAAHEIRISKKIEEINRAYKAAKIPGPTPKNWFGKVTRLKKLSKPMPKGLEHLAGSTVDEKTIALLESGKKAAKAYFASEHADVRAKNLKNAQKKYSNSKFVKKSQAKGGTSSGVTRVLARNKAAAGIVDAYNNANLKAISVKPVARVVADWYLKNFPSSQSKRAITQMLQRAKIAT